MTCACDGTGTVCSYHARLIEQEVQRQIREQRIYVDERAGELTSLRDEVEQLRADNAELRARRAEAWA